jgi:hypothetical protein
MINYLLGTGFAPTPSMFFKAEAAKKTIWDEKLLRHQDYDYLIKFAEHFDIHADPEPSVIINWDPNNKQYDFRSCTQFINKHKKEIAPEIYKKYNQELLQIAKRSGDKEFIEYYAKEATYYIKYVSLAEFLNLPSKRKFPIVYYYKLKFALLNIF